MTAGRMTVFKYVWPLTSGTDLLSIDMPRNAEILCVREQRVPPDARAVSQRPDEQLCIWARVTVNELNEIEPRKFMLCGTGHFAPPLDHRYIGTAMLQGGSLVLHVFEVPREAAP